MAPKQTPRVEPDPKVVDLSDDERGPRARSVTVRRPAQPVRGGGESTFFQMAGAFFLVGGGLLVVGAGIEPVARIAGALDSVGLRSGALLVFGLVLVALGRMRRAQCEVSRMVGDGNENDLLMEQMATDLVQMRNAVDHLQVESSGAQGEMRDLRNQIELLGQGIADAQNAPDESHDAVFRMAASFDKLSARIDQQLHAQFEATQARLREAVAEILSTQRRAGAGGAAAERGDSSARAQIDHDGSLGLLDQIDDYGSDSAPPTSTALAGNYSPAEPPSPLPGAPTIGWEDERKVVRERTPAERAVELDTQTKLMQLNALLADERLRAALENIRRSE